MKATMDFQLLMIILTLSSYVYSFHHCPHKCNCNYTSIKCKDKELEDIPDFEKVIIHPTTVDLSENYITEIKSYHFFYEQFDAIEYLQLNDNNIFKIGLEAFAHLPNLQYLDLSNNQLTRIPSEFVQKNTKLLELNIQGNFFGLQTPKILSSSLLVLDISSSKLSKFTEDHLKGIPNLESLYMHVNNLYELDYNIFINVKLQFLDISYNPWKCNCDTIKMFHHLLEAKLIKIEKPMQCLLQTKVYEDIYDMNGPKHYNRFCGKETHREQHLNDAANIESPLGPTLNAANLKPIKEINNRENKIEENAEIPVIQDTIGQKEENGSESIFNLEILIIIAIISVLFLLSLISLAVVVKKKKPKYRQVWNGTTILK